MQAQAPAPTAVADEYTERIQPIFDGRCISCHSCNNAPCQLNLQNHSGATRGATSLNVYDRFRPRGVAPSRLDIDATSTAQWRGKGFIDVLGATDASKVDASRSLLMKLVRHRVQHASAQPGKIVGDAKFCPADVADDRIAANPAQLGMPYGLPPLAPTEIATLAAWIEHGAPGPKVADTASGVLPTGVREQIAEWESFLNGASPKQKLVSRYLYEHLFLAHLHVAPTASVAPRRPAFFRLVRSRTACGSGVDEIATRRPTDDPGSAQFFYCLQPYTGTIVDKTHIPYELSPPKLERIKATFFGARAGADWSVSKLPAYGNDEANNPFATFADIPVRARYQFLLDDAHYEVATFIKGPSCNGSTAVNSIQEQFFVFFLKPEADSMVASPEHAAKARNALILPGAWGSDVPLLDGIPFLEKLVGHREQYRRLRADSVRTLRPSGYGLADIWDGDGTNPNAVLTVLRHFDNASVRQGAVGDLSKTVFVLDYPLFERLVYNLVVNFDVFGNVGHQSLSRLYMDMIRMEAEELFLTFLPPKQRDRLRRDWYRGSVLTDLKLRFVFPQLNISQPTAVAYRNEANAKTELVQRILSDRLAANVRGPADTLNWRVLRPPQDDAPALSAAEQSLRRLASVKSDAATPFARYFPDLANVLLRHEDGTSEVLSIVHNREHQNVSWIGGEGLRLAPQQDSLTIRPGFLGAYPNMFFVADDAQVEAFSRAAARIKSADDYDRLVARYGMPRTNAGFWQVYDEVNAVFRRDEPIAFGYLDLTRYALAGG